MYRRGLGRGAIADLTGAPLRTVGYHLSVARKLQPGLLAEHDKAASRKPRRVSSQSLTRVVELVAWVQKNNAYPSPEAEDKQERSLAEWLMRRRRQARKGTLQPAFRDGLSVLPDWQGLPRVIRDETRWQERLTALIKYRGSGQDWPRHKANIGGVEHELGVWLHTQRYKARRRELDPAKAAVLDELLPGWRSGRIRGRKPQGIPVVDPVGRG